MTADLPSNPSGAFADLERYCCESQSALESLDDLRAERDRLRDAVNCMAGWAETLAEKVGWTRDNAAGFWAARDVCRTQAQTKHHETTGDECQHDLLKPNTTVEVIDKWKAKCKVCITFFDLPGRPEKASEMQP